MYRFVDAALVRAAAHTPELQLPSWPDLTGGTQEQVAQWSHWLQQVWAQPSLAAAIEVASPTLARRVQEVCDGHQQQPRKVRRAVLSVVRYLLRATGRATPFGLFAGVAPARFGSNLQLHYGHAHRATARVDAEWLDSAITRLEQCPELRRRLPVVLNNLAFVRDGRLVVGCHRQAGAPTGAAPAEVSVRHTTAVATVVQAARSPITAGELAGKLAAAFPETPAAVLEGLLAELVARRVLITSLRPPTTATDPLAHVNETLAAAGADRIPQVAELFSDLRGIQTELSEHNQAPSPTLARTHRTAAAWRMSAIAATERPVSVDLRLDCGLVLPRAVAREAEAAAAVLVRLSPYLAGFPAWQDYHARFLERYGIGALVPLQQLLHADAGLGYPAGYRDSRRKQPPSPGLSERDVRLLALAQQAAMDRSTEVVLDEAAITSLAAADIAAVQVQPHTELRFRVHAPTAAALNRGEFELAVAGVSRAAGATTGRFLDLVDPADRKRMAAVYADLPTAGEGVLPVQVSCPPLYPRAENVARSPAVVRHLIGLGEHLAPAARVGGGEVIPLDDLAVSGDAQRLWLVSLSRRRPLEPVVFSAVEYANAAHPLLRFLCEISTARSAACAPFSWGVASRLPFLPRIRYRRTILAAARWTLTTADLPGPTAPWSQWATRLAVWRRRFGVPNVVDLGGDDRRIRIELDEPAHQYLLRSDLDGAGHVVVREAPPPDAFGWVGGRAHEIVVALAATSRPARTSRSQRAWPIRTVDPAEHGHLPGSGDWLYAKLYGHQDRQTALLTSHLPRLLATWDTPEDPPPVWWFVRYQDPEPHLRLRIRLRGASAFAQTAQQIGAWAAGLRRLGLVGQVQLDTYYPETGRFGSGAAMAAAETVFAADSVAAIAQLAATGRRSSPHPHAIIAASLVDLATSFTGSIGGGMRWLIDHAGKTPAPAPARAVLDQAVRLADPHDRWAALRATPGGDRITAAWVERRAALAAYRDTLAITEELASDPVLADLLHLHHVRMAGIAPDLERVCTRLARAAALSWTTRTQARDIQQPHQARQAR